MVSNSNSDNTSNSDNSKVKKTVLQKAVCSNTSEKMDIPLGATSFSYPIEQTSEHATSTPKDKEIRFSLASQFFSEDEWKNKKEHIESLNPKERTRDRQQALQNFKHLMHPHGPALKQENIEATWRSLNKYFYHVQFSMSTTTATREDTKQLKEMEEQLDKFFTDFQPKNNPGDEHTSVAEDVILRHELKFSGHLRSQQNPSVGAKSTSRVNSLRYTDDWVERVPNPVGVEAEADMKSLFNMATNNFLTFFHKEIKDVLDTNSAPKGFMDIVQQVDRSYVRIQKIYDHMTQSEEDQETMLFIDRKYNDVKDHMVMLRQKDEQELENGDNIDPEIESILSDLNEFANNPDYRPRSELASLICTWIAKGSGTRLSQEQDDEIQELLRSFGKDRLQLTLHLWRSRLCEAQSEAHGEISFFLQYILENWNVLESEGDGSMWAAHASRFTRSNVLNRSRKDRFSIFLDPPLQRQEESFRDPTLLQQEDSFLDPTLQRQEESPQVNMLENTPLQRRQAIPARNGGANSWAQRGSSLAGLRRTQPSDTRPQGAQTRPNTAPPSRTPQQQPTNNVDQIERLANLLERRTTGGGNFNSALKLPPIKVPLFDGNPLEWVNWWPRYKALVHNKQDLEEPMKLLYLQSYVTEKAAKELWGASVESLPYKKAIDILIEKFADEDLLTGIYRDKLKKITFPHAANDILAIRNFVDEAKKYMNCLREFNQMPASYSMSTMDIYRVHMPIDLLHKIADQESKRISQFSLVGFIKALTKYVDLREDTSRFREHIGVRKHASSNPTTTMVTRTRPDRPAMRPGEAATTLPANFDFYKCLYCDVKGVGGHMMVDCPTVKDAKERMNIIRKLERCTCCLSKFHRYNECSSEKTCFCKRKHHTSLHDWFGNRFQNNSSNQQRGAQQQSGNRSRNPNGSNATAGN